MVYGVMTERPEGWLKRHDGPRRTTACCASSRASRSRRPRATSASPTVASSRRSARCRSGTASCAACSRGSAFARSPCRTRCRSGSQAARSTRSPKMIRLATDGLVSFSTAPLRLALDLGFVVSALAFLFGIATLITKLAGAFLVPGWLTIVLVTSFIGGIQLIVDRRRRRVRRPHLRRGEGTAALPRSRAPRLRARASCFGAGRFRHRSSRSCERARRARLPRSRVRCECPSWPRRARVALVVAAAAYVYTRDLHTYPNFDEGNYLGSLDALRHAQALGRDVFLDQPPGWYLLLVAVSYPFGNSVTGVRIGLMVVTLLAIVAAYVCGRLAGGPTAGVVAAAVMAVARPFAGFAALVESEPASAALAVVAVALAVLAYNRRFRPWAACASGAVLAASTLVKLPGATAALPIGGLALLCGNGPVLRRLLAPLLGAAAVCVAIVIAYHGSLPEIWHGVFVTHARILGTSTAASNLHRAATFVDPRTPFGWLVIVGAIASMLVAVRGTAPPSARRTLALDRRRLRLHSRVPPVERPPLRVPRRLAGAARGRRARSLRSAGDVPGAARHRRPGTRRRARRRRSGRRPK